MIFNDSSFHQAVLIGAFISAVLVFFVLMFVTAPYGRHVRKGWGPALNSIYGWIIMELPAPLVMILLYATSDQLSNPVAITFVIMWSIHYLNRTFIYPFRLRGSAGTMPILIVASGFSFNMVNAYLQGGFIFRFAHYPPPDYLWDPRFVIGTVLFFAGWYLNIHSDRVLRNLRKPGETGYRIPYDGAYRWVSCPNYLGEIIEWTGWAIATWSLPGLAFAVWTIANLLPRALANHAWYRGRFPQYPPERKALIPNIL